MVRVTCCFLAASATLVASVARSEATNGGADGSQNDSNTHAESVARSLGLSLLGGVWKPTCNGQTTACDEATGLAPSLQAFVLYQPNRRFGVGFMGQLQWVHWSAHYPSDLDGSNQSVSTDVTTAFGGPAMRVTVFPDAPVSPIGVLSLGAAYQSRPATAFSCNTGLMPSGEIGMGGAVRTLPRMSVFLVADVSSGLASMCGVSDGAPAVPILAWGYGLHAGVSFDVAAHGPPGSNED